MQRQRQKQGKRQRSGYRSRSHTYLARGLISRAMGMVGQRKKWRYRSRGADVGVYRSRGIDVEVQM